MRLWDYALATYARPGVEAACLALQDENGQCATLLLWRLWTLAERRAVGPDLLHEAAAAARAWDEAAVAPLRQARRQLKRRFPPISDVARMALREDLRAAELQAERVLLETLEALTGGPDEASAQPLEALAETALAWGAPAPAEALSTLAAAALQGPCRAGGVC